VARARNVSPSAMARKPEVKRPTIGAQSAAAGVSVREPGEHEAILELQRGAGNRGVGRILDQQGGPAGPHASEGLLSAPGHPLPLAVQGEFERLFGTPLGDVRVHTDRAAAESAEAQGAEAYAIGNQVVFGADRYAPHTTGGRTLLAHELAHVVQQARGAQRGFATPPGAGAERDASAAAGAVAQGSAPQVAVATGIGIARSEEDERKKPAAKGKSKKSQAPRSQDGGNEAPPQPKRRGKKAAPEPEIVGEYQGVPVKRYPPGGKAPKQRTYVKRSVPEEMPEGTHSIVDSPPGSKKVSPETEAGLWVHKNFEQIESIIKPEAEQLTSEQLPPGLRREVEIPDERLPKGRRERADRVDDAAAEVIEIKPKGLRREGEAQAKGYAGKLNRFEMRADGRKLVGRCVTYDDEKVIAFLRKIGYLEPAGPIALKGQAARGGKQEAEAPTTEPKTSPKAGTPDTKAKAAAAPEPSAVPPKIRQKAPAPAPKPPVVKPKPGGELPPKGTSSPKAKPGITADPPPSMVEQKPAARSPGGISKAQPGIGGKLSGVGPRPTFRSRMTSVGVGAAEVILSMLFDLLMAKIREKLDQKKFDERMRALAPEIERGMRTTYEAKAAEGPVSASEKLYYNIQIKVSMVEIVYVAGVYSRSMGTSPDPTLVAVSISPNDLNATGPAKEVPHLGEGLHAVIRIEHTQILTYSEPVEYEQ
jgi:hypothetical protein